MDPEPISRLAILLVGGIILVETGSLAIIRALEYTWDVAVTREGFKLISIEEKLQHSKMVYRISRRKAAAPHHFY